MIDVVGDWLSDQGVANYMVEIGGEVRTQGKNLSGDLWRIAIERPDEEQIGQIFDAVQLDNQGIASSGNYRNFRLVNGQKVAHTIDPQTGYPKMQTLLSATVLAPTCMEADAYATACMVLGLDKSVELISNSKQLEGYLIFTDASGELASYISDGLKGRTVSGE